MKKAHSNIPVFIPQLGCPNHCVFCNQRAISGVSAFLEERAKQEIDTALVTMDGRECEIAYFGGSFTGIDREQMLRLLELAQRYVNEGRVSGIRMSTRPDYITEEILTILKSYTVSAVELGVQSFSDVVLTRSRRGHTAEQTRRAMLLLREAGFPVVGQMMIGLPGASPEDETACAEEICTLGASACRIYPTVVFRATELADMTVRGEYIPLTTEEAVERSAAVLEVFVRNGVECLRIGLCESETLHGERIAGPDHPALGELVEGELYLRRIREELRGLQRTGDLLTVFVPRGELSKALGQHRRNRERLVKEDRLDNVRFRERDGLKPYQVILQYENQNQSEGTGGKARCI